jgi:hypothetical protein
MRAGQTLLRSLADVIHAAAMPLTFSARKAAVPAGPISAPRRLALLLICP